MHFAIILHFPIKYEFAVIYVVSFPSPWQQDVTFTIETAKNVQERLIDFL